MKTYLKTITIALLLFGSGCSEYQDWWVGQKATIVPAVLTFRQESFYPEGMDFDTRNHRFVVGSFRKGEIATIDVTGKATVLVNSIW